MWICYLQRFAEEEMATTNLRNSREELIKSCPRFCANSSFCLLPMFIRNADELSLKEELFLEGSLEDKFL